METQKVHWSLGKADDGRRHSSQLMNPLKKGSLATPLQLFGGSSLKAFSQQTEDEKNGVLHQFKYIPFILFMNDKMACLQGVLLSVRSNAVHDSTYLQSCTFFESASASLCSQFLLYFQLVPMFVYL